MAKKPARCTFKVAGKKRAMPLNGFAPQRHLPAVMRKCGEPAPVLFVRERYSSAAFGPQERVEMTLCESHARQFESRGASSFVRVRS